MPNVEITRKCEVWDNDLGVAIAVEPDRDGSDLIEIHAVDFRSMDYFGNGRFVLDLEFACALADAIREVADHIERSKKP